MRRRLSPAEAELGIRERDLERELDQANALAGTREPRPKPEEKPAPKELHLTEMCERGYWLCRGCNRPTTHAPDQIVCVQCGSPKVEWQPPVFSK